MQIGWLRQQPRPARPCLQTIDGPHLANTSRRAARVLRAAGCRETDVPRPQIGQAAGVKSRYSHGCKTNCLRSKRWEDVVQRGKGHVQAGVLPARPVMKEAWELGASRCQSSNLMTCCVIPLCPLDSQGTGQSSCLRCACSACWPCLHLAPWAHPGALAASAVEPSASQRAVAFQAGSQGSAEALLPDPPHPT